MSVRDIYDNENDDVNTSDEESIDTLGNIPLEWYNELEHQGYDHSGKPLPKPTKGRLDSIDQFLAMTDDPNYYKTVYDEYGNATVLNADDIRLVNAIISNKSDAQLEKDFPAVSYAYDDWMIPLNDYTPPKQRFIPSQKEHIRIKKLAAKLRKQFTFLFHQCLQLYVAPRRLVKVPEHRDPLKELILPPLEELRPFPSNRNGVVKVKEVMRCIVVDPSGEYVASGGDDGSILITEALTGMEVKQINFPEAIRDIQWGKDDVLFIAVGEFVYGMKLDIRDVDSDYSIYELESVKVEVFENKTSFITPNEELKKEGIILAIHHPHLVKKLSLHHKGSYLACVFGTSSNSYCVIHHLPTKRSQNPAKNLKGFIQSCVFHPLKPMIAIATLSKIVIIDLQKGVTQKRLNVPSKSITDIVFHPCGDHLIACSFDKKCIWYDLQAGLDPFKVLRLHTAAVRAVDVHKILPLFATIGDDAEIQIMHGAASSDVTVDPILIPIVKLGGHEKKGQLGGTDIAFHPFLPWIYSTGADGTIQWYSDWF
ncbi:ribosome biogenesis protein bop1, putative [Entamoeba histolytica HM-3:IMSS]|uniref:Ribosome biogenesis protein bop1, putative n=1 Tax=Entamoeba histolytica HM-3:IMSS TaxID=885315 RepID=M7WSX2_ENTHI|nr:ribosome biogenesis protein bop1, putative [Entamoeba histolytica HM-3:IMSS]